MNATREETPSSEPITPGEERPRSAVIVDQHELFRLGVERVLSDVDIRVAFSGSRASDGLRALKNTAAGLLIVGKHSDLKAKNLLRETKRLNPVPRVVFVVDQSDLAEVVSLLNHGVDGLLLRSADAVEFGDSIDLVSKGERVVATAISVGTIGRVGPAVGLSDDEALEKAGLSPKEMEVLGELASGSTYAEIAESLIVTQSTVKTHLVHIYAKLGVRNRHEAVTRALALGLLA